MSSKASRFSISAQPENPGTEKDESYERGSEGGCSSDLSPTEGGNKEYMRIIFLRKCFFPRGPFPSGIDLLENFSRNLQAKITDPGGGSG